jgi:hypothetical protein
MSNRRRHERRTCAELVNLCTDTRKDRVGLARDISASGLRFQSATKFAVGERVAVVIHVPAIGNKQETGRIVRAGSEPDFNSMFPHAGAIEFDAPNVQLVDSVESGER